MFWLEILEHDDTLTHGPSRLLIFRPLPLVCFPLPVPQVVLTAGKALAGSVELAAAEASADFQKKSRAYENESICFSSRVTGISVYMQLQ